MSRKFSVSRYDYGRGDWFVDEVTNYERDTGRGLGPIKAGPFKTVEEAGSIATALMTLYEGEIVG